MTLTKQEKDQIKRLEERMDKLADAQQSMQDKQNKQLVLLRGIAIGLAIAAVMFGWISIKDLVSIAK